MVLQVSQQTILPRVVRPQVAALNGYDVAHESCPKPTDDCRYQHGYESLM